MKAGWKLGRLAVWLMGITLAASVLGACGSAATPAATTAPPPVTAAVTPGPTPEPTAAPTPDPTAEPTLEPTPTAKPTPKPKPTPEPTPEPTPSPTPHLPDALILTPGGLDVAKLGGEPGAVIEALSALLGAPDLDGDWEDSFSTYGTCPGPQIRPVSWGPLLLLFTDGTSAYAKTARPHLFEIRYDDQYAGEAHTPLRIPVTTALGITLGSTKAEIQAAYGANVTFEPESVIAAPAFHVGPLGPGGIYGYLDETNPAATVFELGAGQPCGE